MHIDRVADLTRWEESGAHWQVINTGHGHVTVALLRCDGGEEVERFTSDDPQLLAFIGARTSSEQPR